ncbi:MAG: FAD-dependent oxidoreductase [Leptolyngbya sp. DLM2.Bin15]|nr:MAG: FAD-dependent oxidoreductase [Leptolyngbya sp. DLM2.Bin15]
MITKASGKQVSFWIDSTPTTAYPTFSNGISVDVAIIGAGIVGLTAATQLKKAGKTVAVIESGQVAAGVSGHTTAKVTSLHQLVYADLIEQLGESKARLYGESNQAAIEHVAALVEMEQIDCDFSRQSAYTFAEPDSELDNVKAEVAAALKLGLPASFVQETSLPFAIAGAVKFDNQAQFHVRKYLLHLAQTIPGDGSHLLEHTRVLKVEEEEPCQVITEQGVIHAHDVIVATNLPMLDQGLFFAKTHPKRSYLVGANIDPDKAPNGMFIGSGKESHSIRTTPHNGGLLLIVGGEGHKVGTVTDTEACYQKLETYVRDRFGMDTLSYRWSTQDMVSFDRLPYVGKLTPLSQHTYVATGFSLWGMSKGIMSGLLLSDLILGKENPYAELYDATRATPFLKPELIKNGIDVAARWVGDRLNNLQSSSLTEVPKGEGKLLTINGDKIAAYRDDHGTIHAVSAVCPHLACIVSWNNAETSWDCACHGSRFSCDGKVLHGPSVKDLEQQTIS